MRGFPSLYEVSTFISTRLAFAPPWTLFNASVGSGHASSSSINCEAASPGGLPLPSMPNRLLRCPRFRAYKSIAQQSLRVASTSVALPPFSRRSSPSDCLRSHYEMQPTYLGATRCITGCGLEPGPPTLFKMLRRAHTLETLRGHCVAPMASSTLV
jgi:hypothetical protein